MAGNVARVQPKVLDPAKLARVAKQFIAIGARNEKAKEELGAFAFKEIFESDLRKAISFRHNPIYRSLLSMAKTNSLGGVSKAWVKMIVHVDTMSRVLKSEKRDNNYKLLSYTHKARFVGIDFSRSEFVAQTCEHVVEGEWNVQSLSRYLRNHALRTGDRTLTPFLAKKTVRKFIAAAEQAKAMRISSKSTYRQMLKHFDNDDFVEFDAAVVANAKEWGRFLKDHEAEKAARQKKAK